MAERTITDRHDPANTVTIEKIHPDTTVGELLADFADCRIFIDKNGVPHRVCGRITPDVNVQIDELKVM